MDRPLPIEEEGGITGIQTLMSLMKTNNTSQRPISLNIIAYLAILEGIIAVIGFCEVLTYDRLSFIFLGVPFNIFEIPIGIGLLCSRRWWRSCALVFNGIDSVVCLIMGVCLFFWVVPVSWELGNEAFGIITGVISSIIAGGVCIIVTGLFLLFYLWKHHVLMDHDVKILFGIPPIPPEDEDY